MALTASDVKSGSIIVVTFTYVEVALDFVLHNKVDWLSNFDQISFADKL